MLIYIGTPMVAVGLWKRVDIDKIEASLYRKVMRIGNDIPNTAILNTMTSIRLAGEVIYHLSREAQTEYRRQNRVTTYFDKIDDREGVRAFTNNGDSGTPMSSLNDNSREGMPVTATRNDVNSRYGRDHYSRNRRNNTTTMPRYEKIWVPKSMKNLILSTTANSTSIHFGMNHLYHRHNKLFTLDHIE
jgi:hypothetical protein